MPYRKGIAALLTGRGLSALGDQLTGIAIALWVLETTGSALMAGLSYAVKIAPVVVLAPWAGWLVDRYDKRLLFIASHLGSVVTAGGLLLAVGLESFPGLLAAMALGKAATTISLPSAQAVLKHGAPSDSQRGLVVTSSTISGVNQVVGPLVGALLYQGAGIVVVLWCDLLSFAVCAATGFLLAPLPGNPALPRPLQAGRETVRRVVEDPVLSRVISAEAAYFLLFGATDILGLVLLNDALGGGAAGPFFAASGAGALLTSFVIGRGSWSGHALLRTAALGCAPLAVLTVLLVGLHPAAAAVVGALDGCVHTLIIVGAAMIYQTESGGEEIGRVFALRRMLVNGCFSLSYLLWPGVADLFGTGFAMVVAGGLTTLVLAWMLLLRRTDPVRSAAS
ncbi:MFS transporter [Nonomuraea sp. NPDC050556]|uniref:MFS transporter n=1 Tax=Nonomuraea sp. NPDC050556 TaxID=3364369 RepID=UPI003792DDD7